MDQNAAPHAVSVVSGLLSRPQLATDLKCNDRTIIRYEEQGLPVIRLGALRFYDPAAVLAWMRSNDRGGHVPVRPGPKPGRPRKVAAA